ncbi:MAG: hypothetical protein SFW66_07050 [Gammaproteobacteria bacterium]|nr:hypothetical protein [Gammaproteobacteria bacterium]
MTNNNQFNVDVQSGMLTGVTIAGLFNPLDKALYLSVVNKRPFLLKANFENPWHGFSQAIVSRSISDGSYYVLQSQMTSLFDQHIKQPLHLNDWQNQLGIGLTAGSLRGFLINWLYAIRFRTWKTHADTFYSSARDMWKNGGFRPFMKGASATIGRDAVFGIVYEVTRHNKDENPSTQFARNIVSGSLAAVASSPLNYLRSMAYASSPELKALGARKVFTDLWHESKSCLTLPSKLSFFQRRFLIGYGTARVGLGMAAGQFLFDKMRNTLDQLNSENEVVSKEKRSLK